MRRWRRSCCRWGGCKENLCCEFLSKSLLLILEEELLQVGETEQLKRLRKRLKASVGEGSAMESSLKERLQVREQARRARWEAAAGVGAEGTRGRGESAEEKV